MNRGNDIQTLLVITTGAGILKVPDEHYIPDTFRGLRQR